MSFQEDRVRVRQNKLQGLMSFPQFPFSQIYGNLVYQKGRFFKPYVINMHWRANISFPSKTIVSHQALVIPAPSVIFIVCYLGTYSCTCV